jgi:protein-tyrosine phosphatase
MRCVIDDIVWIGNAAEARDVASLIEQGFDVVVDLAIEEPVARLAREQIYLRFPIYDGVGNDPKVLAAAIKTISQLISIEGIKIVICCSMGISRSPAIVALAMSLETNCIPEESLAKLTSKVPCDISPGLWSDLMQAYDLLKK